MNPFTPGFTVTQDGFTTCVETPTGLHCFRIDKKVSAELRVRVNNARAMFDALDELLDRCDSINFVAAETVPERAIARAAIAKVKEEMKA